MTCLRDNIKENPLYRLVWGWSLLLLYLLETGGIGPFCGLGAAIITRKPNLTTLIEFFYLESLAVVHEEE